MKDFTQAASKISICFELPHSGSLYRILSHLYNDLNIKVNPVEWKEKLGVSFLCVRRNLEQPGVKNAIRGSEARNLKILEIIDEYEGGTGRCVLSRRSYKKYEYGTFGYDILMNLTW